MGTILIDKLLSECQDQGASEFYLTAGQPPVLRVNGRLQGATSRRLRPADTYLLMQCITPSARQQEYYATGNANFEFGFGEACRIRASVIRARGNVAMVLRLDPQEKSRRAYQG